MTVKVLLLTHKEVGTELLNAAKHTLGYMPSNITTLAVSEKVDSLLDVLTKIITSAPEGLLILTDLYGSTPCNIAKSIATHETCEIITGLNLPMLLKTLNYQELPLNELAVKAIEGGKECIRKV